MNERTVNGKIVRYEDRDIIKQVSEGVGDNRTTRIVHDVVYVLTVMNDDGERVSVRSPDPLEVAVGDDITVLLRWGQQTTIPTG